MNKKPFVISLGILAVLLIVGAVYYASSRDTFEPSNGDTQELSQEEIAALVVRVGKLIQLPANEDPLVATIVDVESLVATQPFYSGAQNGDMLLIYSSASKAIIYSPSRNMLVNVGPIVIDDAQQTETADVFTDEEVIEDAETTSSDETFEE